MEGTESNQPPAAPGVGAPPPPPVGPKHDPGKARNVKVVSSVITAVVAIIIAVLAIVAFAGVRSSAGNESGLIDDDAYQTVFLTNGQVYFGKLKSINDNYFELTDIFYLQVQQSVQPSGGSTGTSGSTPSTTAAPAAPAGDSADPSKTQLVKLGDELHGPQDSMQINRSQVQFWENIKNNGKVAEAIKSYNDK